MTQVRAETVTALVRHVLINTAAVQALVKARVRTSHVLDPQTAQGLEYPLVILDLSGGESLGGGVVQNVNLRVWTYARESTDVALKIYDAVYGALHMQRLSIAAESAKGTARELSRPMTGWNDKVLAHYATGIWRINLGA